MRPFVELSFMPTALSSGRQTVFHYRANVTAPKDYAQWSVLIHKLVEHWVERYGREEVRQWFFEVWNEPNLTAFGSGKQSNYFELYRYTVQAIKAVDGELKVGGPATAANAWVADFIGFCHDNALPVDFITTHPPCGSALLRGCSQRRRSSSVSPNTTCAARLEVMLRAWNARDNCWATQTVKSPSVCTGADRKSCGRYVNATTKDQSNGTTANLWDSARF